MVDVKAICRQEFSLGGDVAMHFGCSGSHRAFREAIYSDGVELALRSHTPANTRRCGISRVPDVEGDKPSRKKFKNYPIGFFHIDIAEVRTAEGKLYLY